MRTADPVASESEAGRLSLTGLVPGLPDGPDLNALSDRAAMGLPESFAGPEWAGLARAVERLAAPSPAELAERVEDGRLPFEERYAAGLLLGLCDDPRIDPLDPAMAEVPAGDYPVGLPAADLDRVVREFAGHGVRPEWIRKEMPRHRVRLSGFRIGRYPVTNREYRAFLVATGHPRVPSSWPVGSQGPGGGNLPVFGISPEDADAYARWLSAVTGRLFRLPTEAEWEVAASGGDGRDYPWGNVFLPERANTLEAGILAPTPVGLFPEGRSPVGCFDMAGNVEEYVADDYSPYPGSEAIADDLDRAGTGYRIARGGSFSRYRDLARCKRRHGYYPKAIYAIGFRLAEDQA